MRWLTEPFTEPIVRRAVLELVLLGAVCGPLGVWVLLYRQAFAAESLSHGLLPGLVLAALVGAPLVLGAAGGVAVAAAAIALAGRGAPARPPRGGGRAGRGALRRGAPPPPPP